MAVSDPSSRTVTVVGTGVALLRERRRGVFAVAAFWVPVLILTFLIGYRRPRFMFFAFPFYVCLSSYGIVQLVRFSLQFRRSALHGVVAVLIAVFFVRLPISAKELTLDSVRVANLYGI